MKPTAKHKDLDQRALGLLKHGPCTAFRIAYMLKTDADVARIVLRRLKAAGEIEWRQESEGARLKPNHPTTHYPFMDVFPPPPYQTLRVGWFG